MSESLKDYLESQKVDSDTIQQAAKYYIAELTDDKTASELRAELKGAGADDTTISAALEGLKKDPSALETVLLLVLSDAWEKEGQQQKVRDAVEEAKGKAPVIEIGIIALVGVYGMYLVATGGRRKVKKIVRRRPDNTLEEVEETVYEPPTETLKALVNMVNLFAKRAQP